VRERQCSLETALNITHRQRRLTSVSWRR